MTLCYSSFDSQVPLRLHILPRNSQLVCKEFQNRNDWFLSASGSHTGPVWSHMPLELYTHAIAQSNTFIHPPLTHSLIHPPLTHSLTPSLTHQPTHSLTMQIPRTDAQAADCISDGTSRQPGGVGTGRLPVPSLHMGVCTIDGWVCRHSSFCWEGSRVKNQMSKLSFSFWSNEVVLMHEKDWVKKNNIWFTLLTVASFRRAWEWGYTNCI